MFTFAEAVAYLSAGKPVRHCKWPDGDRLIKMDGFCQRIRSGVVRKMEFDCSVSLEDCSWELYIKTFDPKKLKWGDEFHIQCKAISKGVPPVKAIFIGMDPRAGEESKFVFAVNGRVQCSEEWRCYDFTIPLKE